MDLYNNAEGERGSWARGLYCGKCKEPERSTEDQKEERGRKAVRISINYLRCIGFIIKFLSS